jgi:hypothetical protein
MTDFGYRCPVGFPSVLRKRIIHGSLQANPACLRATAALVSSLLVAFFSSAAKAQVYFEKQTNSGPSAFYGICLNEMFDLSGVRDLAAGLGWQEVSEEAVAAFKPQVEAEILQYWGFAVLTPDDPPLPIALFFGESQDPDGTTEHCSIFFRDDLSDEFRSAFVAETNATVLQEDKRAAGVLVFYAVPGFRDDFVLFEHQTRGPGLRAAFLKRKVGN